MQGTARSDTARAPFPAARGIPDPLPASESRVSVLPTLLGSASPQHRRVPEPSGDTRSPAVLQLVEEHCRQQERAGAGVSASRSQFSAGLASEAVL